jgi:hypothetical protein
MDIVKIGRYWFNLDMPPVLGGRTFIFKGDDAKPIREALNRLSRPWNPPIAKNCDRKPARHDGEVGRT